MRINQWIDLILTWLKWPAALAALWLLPGAALAAIELLRVIARSPAPLYPFLGGCLLYAVLWQLVFRHRVFGSYLSTLEHEATHALFAVATFHRVVGVHSTWNAGGRTSFLGRGNWLITISPYFFPTLCVLLAVPLAFAPNRWLLGFSGLMGFAFAYHIFSTRQETHGEQSDLRRVGFVFAWLFLPTANLLSLGAVVAFSHGGLTAAVHFLSDAVAASWTSTLGWL